MMEQAWNKKEAWSQVFNYSK